MKTPYPRWAWERQRSMRERREVSLGPPTRLDILASVGSRDDRAGGEDAICRTYSEED